jgi:phenylacetate-CoA ligase
VTSLLALYHRLPAGPARSAVATLRGAYLSRWRYGPETDRLVAEALDRDAWDAGRWGAWQDERLAELLHRAATTVPYYRAQWAARRAGGDRAAWDVLANWPVLEKDPVRRQPDAFLADGCRRQRMFRERTSGTTGTPMVLWWSRAAVRQWYALFEARTRRWYGVDRHVPWAILGGQLVAPVSQRRPPYWVWNAAMHQLYLSAYHLSPGAVPHYLRALARYQVRYILGYSSALEALARGAHGHPVPPLAVAVTNAEPLLDHQRKAIEQGLGCAVRETYGMAEGVAAASECAGGRLHLWPDAGVVEVVAAPDGEAGELLATGLLNPDMPLIRYRVGDRATLDPGTEACACGRGLPRLQSVEGRSDDVLYTRDGRPVGRLDPVFKAAGTIAEAQIVQETMDRIRVRLVPTPAYRAADGRSVADEIRRRMGPVEVVVEEVSMIPRSSNGKFRAVVSQLTSDQRPPAQGGRR